MSNNNDLTKNYNLNVKKKIKDIIELNNIILNDNDKINKYTELLNIFENSVLQIKNNIEMLRKKEERRKIYEIDNFVYHDNNGFLNYKNTTPSENIKSQKITKPIINDIYLKEFKYGIKIKTVNSLSEICPMLSYFKGDTKNPAGIYCCIMDSVYVKIPYPEMIDINKDYNKVRTIKCKHITLEKCNEYKNKMMKYNSYNKICNFAHVGDKLVKICNHSRCEKIPNYGNPSTFNYDVEKVGISDIKNILLYGLSDLMCSFLWLDYNKSKNLTFDKLDFA
jgi:hypothetical protein